MIGHLRRQVPDPSAKAEYTELFGSFHTTSLESAQDVTRPQSKGARKRDWIDAQKSARELNILREARTLFVERGFDAVNMDQIADAAGMSKVTIYKYFPSKKELIFKIVANWLALMTSRILNFDAERDSIGIVLRNVAENFQDVFLTDDALGIRRMVLAVLPRFPELGRMIFEAGPSVVIGRLADYFRQENEVGRVRINDPMLAAIQFHSLMQSDIEIRGTFLNETPSRDEKQKRVDPTVDLFLAYYGLPK